MIHHGIVQLYEKYVLQVAQFKELIDFESTYKLQL
jgi:hypothetical protein